MLGLDYSSSDEDDEDKTVAEAPTVAAEAPKRGGEAGDGAEKAGVKVETPDSGEFMLSTEAAELPKIVMNIH